MPIYYVFYIIVILALEGLLVALIWLWWKALRQQQQAFQHATKDTYAELTNIIQKTSHEAEKVMDDALKTAAKLQLTAQNHVEKLEQQTEDLMAKQSHWHEKTLSELLEKYQNEMANQTRKNLQTLQQTVSEKISVLDGVISQEIQNGGAEIKKTLSTQLTAAQKEVAEFREEQIAAVHTQAEKIVSQVAREMLSKSLTIQDQHQLVRQQLLQATTQEKSGASLTKDV